jgi:hypothetical protein
MKNFGNITTDDPETGFGSGGAGEGSCWRFREVTLEFTLSSLPFSQGDSGLGIHRQESRMGVDSTGKKVDAGKCAGNNDPPWKCKPIPGTGKEMPLEWGKERLEIEASYGTKKFKKTTCKECKEKRRDPLAMLIELIGDDGLEFLRDFMDEACRGVAKVVLEIEIKALCNKGIKGNCHSSFQRNKCKQRTVTKYGEGSGKGFLAGLGGLIGIDLPGDESFDILNSEWVESETICNLWRQMKPCLFEGEYGNGPAKPGIANKLAECLDEIFEIDNLIASVNRADGDMDALLIDFATQLAKCLGCLKIP